MPYIPVLFHIYNTKLMVFVNENACREIFVTQYITRYVIIIKSHFTLQWRHNERDVVSNHQPDDCLLNRLFRRRSKKTSKLRVSGLCAGNSPVTSEFLAHMASNAEIVSIWWLLRQRYICALVRVSWHSHYTLFSYISMKTICCFKWLLCLYIVFMCCVE